MIQPPTFIMPEEVIPPGVIDTWRNSLPQPKAQVPDKVLEFIHGFARALPQFQQYQQEDDYIKGEDLLLAGQRIWGGLRVVRGQIYALKVPKTQAIDQRSTMIRLFQKKGKQGLIDYVRVQLRGHSLQRILHHLHVNIFNEADPAASSEFTALMAQINEERKEVPA